MFHEERLNKIISIVDEKKSVTVQELTAALGASESTVRRALSVLDSNGKLTKVFGGAISKSVRFNTRDDTIVERENHNRAEKTAIARYAASLIFDDDFVYLDAGTTTGLIIDFISAKKATFITNSYSHAKRLAEAGLRTFILGGEIKYATEAVIGPEAAACLLKYNFTKGFWGANGISLANGFSTPDLNEALIKKEAMARTQEKYITADAQKFSQVSCVTFADFSAAEIITSRLELPDYASCTNIIEVQKI